MIKRIGMALLLAAMSSGLAQAGLIGHTMRVWHESPNLGITLWGPTDVVAGSGVDIVVLGIYNIDFYDVNDGVSELLITFPGSCCGGFSSATFNGLHVRDLSGNGWVSASFSSNFGFPSGRITFDNDDLYVNFSGVNPNPATAQLIVTLSTPEPSTWLSMAGAIAALALRYRTKRRQRQ